MFSSTEVAALFDTAATAAWLVAWLYGLWASHLTLVDALVQRELFVLGGINGPMRTTVHADIRRAWVRVAVSFAALVVGGWVADSPYEARPLHPTSLALAVLLVGLAWAWALQADLDRRAKRQAVGQVKAELAATMRAKETT